MIRPDIYTAELRLFHAGGCLLGYTAAYLHRYIKCRVLRRHTFFKFSVWQMIVFSISIQQFYGLPSTFQQSFLIGSGPVQRHRIHRSAPCQQSAASVRYIPAGRSLIYISFGGVCRTLLPLVMGYDGQAEQPDHQQQAHRHRKPYYQ